MWPKTPQNAAKLAPGGQTPRLPMRSGHSEGWKPPEVGFDTGKMCRQNQHSVRLAQDTANFRFWITGRNLGPQTPFEGKKRTKHDKRAAPKLPNWIMSTNGDTKPRRRHAVPEPSGPVFGPFRTEKFPFGHAETQCGRKVRNTGRKRTPKIIFLGSQDPSRGLRKPDGTFQTFRNFGASCGRFWCLLVLVAGLPVWDNFVLFGPAGADGGRKTGNSGPKDGCWGSQDPFRQIRGPNGQFHFVRNVGASCRG